MPGNGGVKSAVPALLLVHGGWHGPECWQPLIDLLSDLDVRTVSLPSSGFVPAELGDLQRDVEVVRAAVASAGGPLVVCAHSYGGVPVTEAISDGDDVRRLVYLSAFQLDVGESVAGFVGEPLPDWIKVNTAEGYADALRPEDVFYGDVDLETRKWAVQRLRHQSLAALGQPVTRTAWRSIPSTYIVCEKDATIPPFAQEAMARRAQQVRRLDTSHFPFLSRPAEVAALLREELVA